MSFLKIVPYIVIPCICMGIGIFISIFNKVNLQKRIDLKSKIRAEAREPHRREDHNHRLLEDSESCSLWCNDKVDKGILKMFQEKMRYEESK